MSRRTCAWLIDICIGAVAAYVFVRSVGGGADLSLLFHLVTFKSVQGRAGHELSAALRPGTAGLHALRPILGLLFILTVVAMVGAAYRIVSTALWGAGFGKRLLGLRIVADQADADGELPGWSRSWRRWLVPQAPGLIPLPATGLLAFLPAFRDPRRRGLHDRAAGTIVVDIRPARPQPPAPARAVLAPCDGYELSTVSRPTAS